MPWKSAEPIREIYSVVSRLGFPHRDTRWPLRLQAATRVSVSRKTLPADLPGEGSLYGTLRAGAGS
jgi:hypothetical protein